MRENIRKKERIPKKKKKKKNCAIMKERARGRLPEDGLDLPSGLLPRKKGNRLLGIERDESSGFRERRIELLYLLKAKRHSKISRYSFERSIDTLLLFDIFDKSCICDNAIWHFICFLFASKLSFQI